MSIWLLPEQISDVLPSEARKIEEMRRQLLDCIRSFGYEFVMPPLLEYVDSLTAGMQTDLNQNTFKWQDAGEKMLGIRADITPQIARIDAHLLNRAGITRLCYADHVLHRNAHNYATRQPFQVGAEIYGTNAVKADIEIIELALKSLNVLGLNQLTICLSHAQFLQALAIPINSDLHQAIMQKNSSKIKQSQHPYANLLLKIIHHHDIDSVMQCLLEYQLNDIAHDFKALLQGLQHLNTQQLQFKIDLGHGELYQYHTGLNFSIYTNNHPYVIAKGGRYDAMGSTFGRSRFATGFSVNLRQLSILSNLQAQNLAIWAPWLQDAKLQDLIEQLRKNYIVVQLEQFEACQELEEFKFIGKVVYNQTLDNWELQLLN